MMSTSLLNSLSRTCPCPSVPPTIQAWTYNWVMLSIVLYDGVMLVGMTWYSDDSVTTVRDDCSWWWCRFQYCYCMPGTMKYILSSGNDTNGNTTDSSSSLSAAAAVTVASSWVRRVYNTQSGRTRQYILLLFVKGMRHFFPFFLPLIILVLVDPFDIYYHFNSIPCLYLIQ